MDYLKELEAYYFPPRPWTNLSLEAIDFLRKPVFSFRRDKRVSSGSLPMVLT